jgi:flagellar biogenesis protein FliO
VEVVQQVFAVLFVFGLLGLAVWKLRAGGPRRFSWPRGRSQAQSLEAVERIALTAQHAVHLLRIHGRELVVVTHPHGCALLLPQDAEKVL